MDSAASQSRFIGVDALFQYAGSGIQLFSGIVFYIIAVRLFSTSSVGAIALFVAIIGLFNLIFSFGLATAAQHFTSYNLGKGDFASVKRTIYHLIMIGSLLSVAGLISLQILSREISVVFFHSPQFTELVRVLSVVLFGNIMFGILNGAILGIQQFRISAIISMFIWTTYYFGALVFAIFLRSLETIVFGWLIGIFLGVAIELIVILSTIRKYLGEGRPPPNGYILRYSAPILMSGLISYGAAYSDRFIVSGLLSLSALGIYNFSLLISSSITFLAIPFNNILMPKFSELFARNERNKISSTVEVTSTLLSYFYVPCALGIAALAPNILHFLGGDEYSIVTLPLRIIMFITAVFVSQNILTQVVASIRKTRMFLYSSGLAMLSNIILSFTLIPRLGLVGAAIGYSSVYAITFGILYFSAFKESVLSFNLIGILKIWASALLMFISVYFVSMSIGPSNYFLPIYVIIGATIYLVLTRLMRIFKGDNKDLILSLFPSKFTRLRKIISLVILP